MGLLTGFQGHLRWPGRTSTLSRSSSGWICTLHTAGSFSPQAAVKLSEGTISICQPLAAGGTWMKRSGTWRTLNSLRREVKRQRVPSAVLLPVMSSHCFGSFLFKPYVGG